MAVELALWLIVTILGGAGFLIGGLTGKHYLFVLGCALLIGSGALLWGGNGLLLDHQPTGYANDTITYTDIIVTMSDIGLQMLALALVGVGVISMLWVDFGGSGQVRRNTYHY